MSPPSQVPTGAPMPSDEDQKGTPGTDLPGKDEREVTGFIIATNDANTLGFMADGLSLDGPFTLKPGVFVGEYAIIENRTPGPAPTYPPTHIHSSPHAAHQNLVGLDEWIDHPDSPPRLPFDNSGFVDGNELGMISFTDLSAFAKSILELNAHQLRASPPYATAAPTGHAEGAFATSHLTTVHSYWTSFDEDRNQNAETPLPSLLTPANTVGQRTVLSDAAQRGASEALPPDADRKAGERKPMKHKRQSRPLHPGELPRWSHALAADGKRLPKDGCGCGSKAKDLARHWRRGDCTHNPLRPTKGSCCSHCGKYLNRKDNVKRHMKLNCPGLKG